MVGEPTRFSFSKLCSAPPVQFIESVRATLPSITMRAIRALWSIQTDMPTPASGSRPLLLAGRCTIGERPHITNILRIPDEKRQMPDYCGYLIMREY
jgi:hypothetical protein